MRSRCSAVREELPTRLLELDEEEEEEEEEAVTATTGRELRSETCSLGRGSGLTAAAASRARFLARAISRLRFILARCSAEIVEEDDEEDDDDEDDDEDDEEDDDDEDDENDKDDEEEEEDFTLAAPELPRGLDLLLPLITFKTGPAWRWRLPCTPWACGACGTCSCRAASTCCMAASSASMSKSSSSSSKRSIVVPSPSTGGLRGRGGVNVWGFSPPKKSAKVKT